MKAALKKGETISTQIDSSMMVLKWMDKRPVVMLSTIHDDSFVTKKRRSRTVLDWQEKVTKEGRTTIEVVRVDVMTSALQSFQQLYHYCVGHPDSWCVEWVILSYKYVVYRYTLELCRGFYSFCIPVYSRQLYVYPFLLSARTNAFIPHLVVFFWEVLDEGQSALEANHRLVDGQLTGGVVG